LKIVNTNVIASDSSADRTTSTPHSTINDAPNIFIKDEEERKTVF